MDKLLSQAKLEIWNIDDILVHLVNRIRGNEEKKVSITEYIERYADTFKRWDEESQKSENEKVNLHERHLIKAYKILVDSSVSNYDKCA